MAKRRDAQRITRKRIVQQIDESKPYKYEISKANINYVKRGWNKENSIFGWEGAD